MQIEDGDWRYDSRKSMLVWGIDLIDQTNKSGAMEFVVPATDSGSFFPIEVWGLLNLVLDLIIT